MTTGNQSAKLGQVRLEVPVDIGLLEFIRACFTIGQIFNLTKIDRWFLVQIKEIVDFEKELAESGNCVVARMLGLDP